jgi:RecB family exonuclease
MVGVMVSHRLPRLQVAPYGAPARRALAAVIEAAQQGDRLAPVTVIVPSALAGTTLKRALATQLGGLAAVGFESLPGLVLRLATGRLAAAGRPLLDDLTARALAHAVLADRPGPFAAVADHPSTVAAVVDTLAELRPLTDAELGALAGTSERGADVVRLSRAFAHATAGWAHTDDALVEATAAAAVGEAVVDELGLVVLHLPRRLGRRELALLEAFAAHDRLAAIVGITGRAAADAPAREIVDALVSIGLPADDGSWAAKPVPVSSTTIVCAPDPAEEARHAVRLVRDAIRDGTVPERIAVVSRVREPYALLAHEELEAAGINHSAPSPSRLAQTMTGRTLLGLLDWLPNGARRDHLMRVLRGAPVRDADGRRAQPDWWDRAAREAGVVSGLEQWRSRLGAARAEREQRVIDKGEPPADDDRLVRLDALSGFVEHIAVLLDPGERIGWRPLAHWARVVLERSLGGMAVVARWPDEEQAARAQIIDLLERLANLPAVGPAPDAEAFVRVLQHELQRGSGRIGRFGAGVTVGRLVDAVGADLDLVIVLGVTEGTFPPHRPDDAVLPARHRGAVPALRLRGSSREEEERDVWAVLAGASQRVLTTPAADPRSQREQHPAPWLLELDGRKVSLPSFEAWLGHSGAPATPTERDVAELLAAHRAGAAIDDLPAVTATGIARGLALTRSRATGGFDEWAGNVGPHPLLSGELAEHRSPTGLETFATCPFRYYLGKVLGVRPLDDPGTVETIEPRDRGSLVHEVLEKFVTARLNADPAVAWDADARLDLAAIADEVEALFRHHGRTGRQLLWEPEWRALQRHFAAIIEHGTVAPELTGLVPIAVEHGFGHEGEPAPAVEIEVGDGTPLRFGGRIDRVDASPDRSRVVVVDYKTASGAYYRVIEDDPVDRGRLLQLPIYALAARQLVPEARSVAAYYWFVSPRARIELLGGEFDEAAEERFRDVLATIVRGIEHGLFPARPGKDAWVVGGGETYESCRFCDYNRVCPTGRADRWDRVRLHGSLARYVDLAEGDYKAEVGS